MLFIHFLRESFFLLYWTHIYDAISFPSVCLTFIHCFRSISQAFADFPGVLGSSSLVSAVCLESKFSHQECVEQMDLFTCIGLMKVVFSFGVPIGIILLILTLQKCFFFK